VPRIGLLRVGLLRVGLPLVGLPRGPRRRAGQSPDITLKGEMFGGWAGVIAKTFRLA
jgi:hypothetical protein